MVGIIKDETVYTDLDEIVNKTNGIEEGLHRLNSIISR